MSPYTLHCTVCEKKYNRSEDWTTHLFGSYHQIKARLKCAEWEETRKECALVAFFSCPIISTHSNKIKVTGKCDEEETNLVILLRNYLLMTLKEEQAFSRPLLLTDFVMWNEQPKMCVLQLESREIVNQVHTKLVKGDNGIQKQHKIGNGKYLVQFKKLVDLLELEWRILIPDSNHRSQKRSLKTADMEPPLPKKSKIDANGLDPDPVPIENPKFISNSNNIISLTTQYNDIINSIQIPSHLLTKAVQLTQQIKDVLRRRAYPKCEVVLLRSHSLKIKNRLYRDQNDFLIFVYGGCIETKGFKKLKLDNVVNTLLRYLKSSGLKKSTEKTISNEPDLENKSGQRFKLFDRQLSSTTYFHLFTDLCFGVEAQLNRLFNYMCQFDLRCHSVISLLHYFCTVNKCYFDDPLLPGEPMEWLVILFMSNKKLIPTVREILTQKHEPIWQMSVKRKIDIGFQENDPIFLKNWNFYKSSINNNKLVSESKEESVLKLFQEFLSFMGNVLADGNLVLNVRDGEILNRNWLFGKEVSKVVLKTELTEEEISAIISSPAHLGKWNKWPFSIVNPLAVNLKVGFQVEKVLTAMKLMKVGADRLGKYLDDVEKHETLKSILKIDGPTKKRILKEKLPWQESWTKSGN